MCIAYFYLQGPVECISDVYRLVLLASPFILVRESGVSFFFFFPIFIEDGLLGERNLEKSCLPRLLCRHREVEDHIGR